MTQPTVARSVEHLIRSQNSGGGWSYLPAGPSWAEPTAFALLALHAADGLGRANREAAVRWLISLRRSGGGWAPGPAVRESTWVTALVAFVFAKLGIFDRGDPSINWLLQTEGAESGVVNRLRRWMMGGDTGEIEHDGWPWYPGASAWVAPTAITLLALEGLASAAPSAGLQARIGSGRRFLLSRRCADGGWNHGSSRALGYDGSSYPETTGMALLALRGAPGLPQNVYQRAQEHLSECRSMEGWSWLYMGLRAHGIQPAKAPPDWRRPGTMAVSLHLIASAAMHGVDVWRPKP